MNGSLVTNNATKFDDVNIADDLEKVSLAHLYPACCRSPLSSWPSWISAGVRSHSRLGPEGHTGHLITNAPARPFLDLLFPTRRPRREANPRFGDQLEPSTITLVNLSVFIQAAALVTRAS